MRLALVDSVGGSLASMGAAVARALGSPDACAGSTGPILPAPPEVERALAEIGLVPVAPERVPDDATVLTIDDGWGARLYTGDGELERMANARIARDRIERRLHQLLGKPLL